MAKRGSFDFETYDWIHPLCCGLMTDDGETYFIEDETQRNPDYVAEQTLKLMLATHCYEWWAHNMGKYDGLFLSAAAKRLGWRQSAHIAAGRIIMLQLIPPGDNQRSLHIQDSYAVLPSRLKQVADDWDLPSKKLFTEDDYSIDVRKWDKQRLREGCLIDCKIVLEALAKVESVVEDWGGRLKATFSATALSVVKASLSEKHLEIPSHKRNRVTHLNRECRKGFYGARVEVLHHCPSFMLNEWDICSSYPWAMSQALPWHPIGVASEKAIAYLLDGNPKYEGLVEAQVTVPDMEYPPLPFRSKRGGIYFPHGTWQASFPAVELRYAMALGVKVQPIGGVIYTAETPFDDYVRRIYDLKRTAQGAVRTFAKLCLNGSYGKFGQKPEKEDLQMFASEADARNFIFENQGKCIPLSADMTALVVKRIVWSHHSHFAIASYITALARMKLHAAMQVSKGLAYVDSDSIHAASMDLLNSTSTRLDPTFGNDLGDWKLEIERYHGKFYAPKIYHLETAEGKHHYAAKGFPVNAEAFAKLIAREKVEVQRMQLCKMQVRRNNLKVERETDAKQWHGISRKRFAYKDGSTRPWHVSELFAGKHLKMLSPI